MDRSLAIGYACLYLRSAGRGETKTPVKWAYRVVHSPGEALRWIYEVVRDLPQPDKGGFLESRGLFDFSGSFRHVVETAESSVDWTGAWLLADGQAQFRVMGVHMLPIVPLAQEPSP
jgi:hypothetical protein